MRIRWLAAPSLLAVAALIAACGSSSSSGGSAGAASGSGSGIKTVSAKGGTVLVNTAGHAIYWFAIDTPKMSNCNGTCASFWPPVPASQKVASGVSLPGTWGSITRSDGSKQLTYDGHPLYTFKLDTTAGEVSGNGKNIEGGLWWAATPSMAKLSVAAPAPSSSTSSGGSGGYGY